jgi:hypothetical protein
LVTAKYRMNPRATSQVTLAHPSDVRSYVRAL